MTDTQETPAPGTVKYPALKTALGFIIGGSLIAYVAGLAIDQHNGIDSLFDNPRALNDENIRTALARHVTRFPCVSIAPVNTQHLAIRRDDLMRANSVDDLFPITLRSTGSITFNTSPIVNLRHLAFYGLLSENRTAGGLAFSLTDEGRRMLAVYEYADNMGTVRKTIGLCAGRGAVGRITDYSIPPDSGRQITRVQFSWIVAEPYGRYGTITGAAQLPGSWSDAIPQERGTATAVLELTNNGWQVRQVGRAR